MMGAAESPFPAEVWSSPAKLNFHLQIGPPREDGFHPLVSLFQMVEWADSMEIRCINRSGGGIQCLGVDVPEEDNLAVRAFRNALSLAGAEEGALPFLEVRIEKRLPAGGGIGGGSGNAGTLLRYLGARYPRLFPGDTLQKAAEKTGSDVPFFLGTPAALVEGRGEIVTPLTPARRLPVLFLIPEFGISTAEAYWALDRSREVPGSPPAELPREPGALAAAYQRSPSEWPWFNDFIPALEEAYPAIPRGLAELRKTGAEYASMSGSGSLLYGIYTSPADRDRAADELGKQWNLQKTFLLDRFPDPSYY